MIVYFDRLFNLGAEDASSRQPAGLYRSAAHEAKNIGQIVKTKTPTGNGIGIKQSGPAALGWRKA